MKEIIITDFLLQPQSIIISYKSSEKIEAWLEDFNKHNPNIMSLDIDYKLVIEVDDPESFVRNNVREKTELYEVESAGKVYRHFIYGSPQVTAYVEPHGDKYRILMTYFA